MSSSYSVYRPGISIQQAKHFSEHYKDLENEKWVKVTHWGGVEDAHQLILERRARAEK
jgi:inorganic pyrophosphatase